MDRNRRILVLDFDGVICNSIHDSFATALNTYIDLMQVHILTLKTLLASDEVLRFEKDFPGLFKTFSDLMPLASRAEDYFVLLSSMDSSQTNQIQDQEDFNDFKKRFTPAQLNDYHVRFYQIRSRMRETDLEKWLNLLPPFPGVVDTIRALSDRFILAVSTSKDRSSVQLLLNKYGLSDCFKPENICDKDQARSKREHLIRLQKEHQLPFSQMHFIDDKVSHLLLVKDLGVRNYLACWGFNSEREVRIALKEGFTPIQLEDLGQIGNLISG